MNEPNANDDDDDNNSATTTNEIHLFEQEELEFLEIQLSVLNGSITPPNNDGDEPTTTTTTNETSAPPPPPPQPLLTLRLLQFGTSSEQWGVHSTVWDGGIALLHYVATHWDPVVQLIRQQHQHEYPCCREEVNATAAPSNHNTNHNSSVTTTYLIDLGSGTGVTGLAISALTRGRCAVALTDQAEALSLLEQNVQRNSNNNANYDETHLQQQTHEERTRDHTGSSSSSSSNIRIVTGAAVAPVVHELTWGRHSTIDWLADFLDQEPPRAHHPLPSTTHKNTAADNTLGPLRLRRILITGADIVYRPSLFAPLLTTLFDLHTQLLALGDDTTTATQIDIYLSCQSVRSHLNEFWTMAHDRGWKVRLLALVQLYRPCKTDLSRIRTTVPVVETKLPTTSSPLTKGHEVNWIVSLSRIEE